MDSLYQTGRRESQGELLPRRRLPPRRKTGTSAGQRAVQYRQHQRISFPASPREKHFSAAPVTAFIATVSRARSLLYCCGTSTPPARSTSGRFSFCLLLFLLACCSLV